VVIVAVTEDEARVEPLFAGETLLGFDSESRPSSALAPRNRTALAQLASEHAACLWRLGELRTVPPLLRRLLEDPAVLKVAQGATHEIAMLREEWGVSAQSFIDLHHIALNLRTTPRSLQGLVALFLQQRLSKEQRLTDWEQVPLTQAQIEYAAADAWAARQVLVAARRTFAAERLDCERVLGTAAGTPRPQPTAEASGLNSPRRVAPATAVAAAPAARAPTATPTLAQAPPPEAHQALAGLCIARGHGLRFEGFESAPGGFRCVFRVEFRHRGRLASELFRSVRVHSTIRDAQNDAATEALARLEALAEEGGPFA